MVHKDGMDNRIVIKYNPKSAVLNYHQVYSLLYPSFILDVHVSSFSNKVFHCVVTAFASRNMQESPLIEGSNKFRQW